MEETCIVQQDSPVEVQRCHSFGDYCDEQLSALPEKLQQMLLPFQKDGFKFAVERGGRCMIADEMGLGKTVQAISVAYFYKEEWPLLIVVPSSLKYPWIEELEKWIPELNPDDITLIEHKADTGRISTSKVVVLGYGLLSADARMLVDALYRQNFQVVVVDESHYMKSRNATRSKLLVPVVQKAKRAILLTGTPALGRPEELFMQIDALYPRRFGTWSEYAKRYCNAHVRYFGKRTQWDCRGASNLDELHLRLNCIMIRRLKDEVLTQLPAKIRQRIPFDLPKEAAKEVTASIEEWEKLMRMLDSGAAETGNPFIEVMGLITRIYKQTAVAKAGAVKDYIKMMLENEKLKFLVFAHHLTMLQACTEAAIESKARYIRIDGSVPSSERIHLVHQFQNDPTTRVAVLSIQAAGQGLTFTAATHVVFAELYWDPGHVKQAEDRAHRIGQKSSVHVHYLIAKGTLDPLMWGMLNRKACVMGNTLNGKKERLKAEECDKEKRDFLSFSKAWTPNEILLQNKDDMFFTHFEKDKQHDIRSFFSPKSDAAKKCKRSSVEIPAEITKAQEPVDLTEPGEIKNHFSCEENREVVSEQILKDPDFQPEAKRFRTQGTPSQSRNNALKRKSRSGKPKLIFTVKKSGQLANGVNLKPSGALEKFWNCTACTYSNSPLLPYCEVCEIPRSNNNTEKENPHSNGSHAGRPVPKGDEDCVVISDSEAENEEKNGLLVPENLCYNESESRENNNSDANEPKDSNQNCTSPEDVQNENSESSSIPPYDSLMFFASRNTDRIYIYKDGKPLNCNFIPMDITLENWEDLPDVFHQKQNRILILRFVREWCSLTTMKQRIIRKSGQIFSSPIMVCEDISKEQRRSGSTKRYLSKDDVAKSSIKKAHMEGGSVRVIRKESKFTSQQTETSGSAEDCSRMRSSGGTQETEVLTSYSSPDKEASDRLSTCGYLQAVDKEGNPLCVSCYKPASHVKEQSSTTAWDTRFCSLECQEDFQIRSSQSYMRAKVFEIEHGLCQHCGLNAQELYLLVRDAPKVKRKELLESTWLSQLPLEQLNELIRNPTEGLFWQVDHIKPVYSGGGQCSLENLQTLCTVCHKERTAKQAKERSQMKRLSAASKHGTDITKFLIKK
ncbi:DNA annealing helicase and endonuclease ZRANB3 [Protopterus annectens]|uniref:DNA annealing helicase and endonuclease ZRANB3 n=1 Tax=Protopterus annectens TaxID=7888 RepID=UPI001CFC289A|nr:DNA annealing helicase and endonuclease ZRANB3 [Protopterus annectens]